MIRVRFSGGLEIATPIERFPRLANASPSQRVRWQLNGRGYGIHWPDVDEDISVPGLFAESKPLPQSAMEQVPRLIGDLLRTTGRLNQLFKDRPFTPDGHLVGSIGEVVAEYVYGLRLAPCSTPQVDAWAKDGKSVQVKLTGERGNSFGFRWSSDMEEKPAEILICLKLSKEGFQEIYNGPFPAELLAKKIDQKNGQVSLAVSRLRAINPKLLPEVKPFSNINQWFVSELADVA
jgi:hypothetical protein